MTLSFVDASHYKNRSLSSNCVTNASQYCSTPSCNATLLCNNSADTVTCNWTSIEIYCGTLIDDACTNGSYYYSTTYMCKWNYTCSTPSPTPKPTPNPTSTPKPTTAKPTPNPTPPTPNPTQPTPSPIQPTPSPTVAPSCFSSDSYVYKQDENKNKIKNINSKYSSK